MVNFNCMGLFLNQKGEFIMGKDLKGKELGLGISQRQDGMYTGRFTTKSGKRKQKYFHKLQECRAWIAEARFQDEHGDPFFSDSPTADAWFEYWIEEVKGNSIRPRTKEFYEGRWRIAISPVIGEMELKDLKPIHCQRVLNELNENHAVSYIKDTRILLSSILDCAVENGFISKNPVTKSVRPTGGIPAKEVKALTLEEQRKFLISAQRSENHYLYAFALQTGLRFGELAALTWDDIDFKNRKMIVSKSMQRIKGKVIIGEPKTETGKREIPLTEEAIKILRIQKEKDANMDFIHLECANLVFVNKNGRFLANNICHQSLKYICQRAKIRNISMHVLRHTFATRCIESGMRPKTLQAILGHKKLETTMDLYVHVTDESKAEEMEAIERKLKLV